MLCSFAIQLITKLADNYLVLLASQTGVKKIFL